MKWKVQHDWEGTFSTYERALRRARYLAKRLKQDFTVLEIDGPAQTPVAVAKYNKATK